MPEKLVKCAVCGALAAAGGPTLDGLPLCSAHGAVAAGGNWVSLGYYRRREVAEGRADILRANSIDSIIARCPHPDCFRLYVRSENRPPAQRTLAALGQIVVQCMGCGSEFSRDQTFCPRCGEKAPNLSSPDKKTATD